MSETSYISLRRLRRLGAQISTMIGTAKTQAITTAEAHSDANLATAKSYTDGKLTEAKSYTDSKVGAVDAKFVYATNEDIQTLFASESE